MHHWAEALLDESVRNIQTDNPTKERRARTHVKWAPKYQGPCLTLLATWPKGVSPHGAGRGGEWHQGLRGFLTSVRVISPYFRSASNGGEWWQRRRSFFTRQVLPCRLQEGSTAGGMRTQAQEPARRARSLALLFRTVWAFSACVSHLQNGPKVTEFTGSFRGLNDIDTCKAHEPVSGIEGHSSWVTRMGLNNDNLVAWGSVDLHDRCDWPLKWWLFMFILFLIVFSLTLGRYFY